MLEKVKIKIINNKFLTTIIIILIILLIIFIYNFICNKTRKMEEDKLISSFFGLQENVPKDTKSDEILKDNVKDEINYIGVLEIPSINLKKGFFSQSSKLNTVDVGLEVIKESQMPDTENSSLVIAGHSGRGYLAFFKDLDKIVKDDLLYIYYKNYKYIYKLESKSILNKNGKIDVELDANKQWLILTTCNPNNRDKEQLVLISKLISKQKYLKESDN